MIPPWTPFVQCFELLDERRNPMPVPDDLLVFRNSRYEVWVRADGFHRPFGRVLWLSIKRVDKQAVRNWRDFQRIKNELVGAEATAVEIYPPESELVDSSNQYHLFVFVDGYRLHFGYSRRDVTERPGDDPRAKYARQEPFEAHVRPPEEGGESAPLVGMIPPGWRAGS